MEWLNTASNIVTIIAFLFAFPAAFKRGRDMLNKHGLASWALALVIALAAVANIALLADRLGFLPVGGSLTVVSDQTFHNKSIVLDGHEYTHCKFYNVTLKFNGGAFTFINNEVFGVRLASDNPDISKTFNVLAKLGFLKIPVFDQKDQSYRTWGGI
jgi:hypothetical protein